MQYAWVLAAVLSAAPVVVHAQSVDSGDPDGTPPADDRAFRQDDRDRELFASVIRRGGTPSTATATVSSVTAAQAMDRLDPLETPFDLSLGTSIASGDFGARTDTTIFSTALSARYAIGDLRLSASLPWMRIRSSGTVFSGIDGTPVVAGPGRGPRRTRSGLGNLTLGAAYTVTPADDTEIELSGKVKLDTAGRSSGLSSGAADYSVGVQVARPMGRITPFVSASYRFLGDVDDWDFRNGLAASAGTSVAVGETSLVLISYHFAEAATRFVDDAHEIFFGASTTIPGSRLALTAFATAGLSSGASDVSTGLALSAPF